MKTARRQSSRSLQPRRRRIRSPSSSALSLGKNDNEVNRIISQSSSILSGQKPSPGVFWFADSRKHHSDTAFTKSPLGKMPDWITMQGTEHQRRARSIPDFLSGGHYGYQQQVYQCAADIFERLAIRKISGESLVQYGILKSDAALTFPSPKVKRQAYELAYETLKYQELLEDILADSGYFFSYPTADDTTALVVVMLFDFQNRKWTPKCQIIGEAVNKEVAEVEQNLMGHRIRLAAALARCRVKNQSLSIDYVLPESVRQQEKCASTLPQYAWVNTAKTSIEKVVEELIRNNYEEFLYNGAALLPPRGKFFLRDQHCEDVLLFPGDQKEALKCLDIVEEMDLVLQDKTSSLAAQAVAALLSEDDECDLIHSDVASGYTTAHLAVLLHKVSKKRFEARALMYGSAVNHYGSALPNDGQEEELHRPTVFACGVRNDAHREKLNTIIKTMGLKNVKLLSDKFENIDASKDPRFGRVKAILVTPQCTRTAVANPIEFMLNEGDTENYAVLRDLSHGERHTKAAESGRAHVGTVKAALKFPDIQACVYVTRSVHSVENEQVIQTAIKWYRETADSLPPFRLCPPILPLTSNDVKEEDTVGSSKGYSRSKSSLLQQKYLRMRQSSEMNGCFVAVLTREVDPMDSMTVKEILKKAALKGLIAPTSPSTKPKEQHEPEKVEKPASPPSEVKPAKEETHHVEKLKKHKSKVAFGKKVKPSSGTNIARLKKTNSKIVDSNDVDKMLNQYKNTTKDQPTVAGQPSDVAQASINLEFHNPATLRCSESQKHDSAKISSTCMQNQINSDVETILTRLSSRDASRM